MNTQLEISGRLNLTESRALELLGSGAAPEQVAAACGVSVSRISQLLSDTEFAAAVADLRFQSLSKHNTRDSEYDNMEDALLERMKNLLPLMMRPMEVLRAISVINAAKRRGASAPSQVTQSGATVVNITLPQIIVDRFTNARIVTNSDNQVVKAGEQDLVTMQSGTLFKQVKGAADDEFSTRAAANKAIEDSTAAATSRATQLLLRAKAQITGGESSQGGRDIAASAVEIRI